MDANIQRYSRQQRPVLAKRSRGSALYRLHKKNQQKKERTPAELQAAVNRRETEKAYTQALNDGITEVLAIAERIHAEHPHHTTTKIYQALLQRARKTDKTRSVSEWNAFQSQRAEEINAGKCSMVNVCHVD